MVKGYSKKEGRWDKRKGRKERKSRVNNDHLNPITSLTKPPYYLDWYPFFTTGTKRKRNDY